MWLSGGAFRSSFSGCAAGSTFFGAWPGALAGADEAAGVALGVAAVAGVWLWACTSAGASTALRSTAAHRGERMTGVGMGPPNFKAPRADPATGHTARA